MPRDKATGKQRGFAFIAYEDQRSTVLAVDNFNGAKLLGRTLRVDHCACVRSLLTSTLRRPPGERIHRLPGDSGLA
eukprot:1024956-Pleurochrysis_carterae.AAC.1